VQVKRFTGVERTCSSYAGLQDGQVLFPFWKQDPCRAALQTTGVEYSTGRLASAGPPASFQPAAVERLLSLAPLAVDPHLLSLAPAFVATASPVSPHRFPCEVI
jgi:hypothetical protein